MKRAKQLQPLSRQHHLGLNLSRHAKECADTPQDISKHWQSLSGYLDEMSTHFKIEDNIMANALQPYQASKPDVKTALATLDEQHKQLHQLVAGTANQNITAHHVRQLGDLLYEHIRFEERELFPLAEQYLTEQQLDAIYDASPDSIKRLDESR